MNLLDAGDILAPFRKAKEYFKPVFDGRYSQPSAIDAVRCERLKPWPPTEEELACALFVVENFERFVEMSLFMDSEFYKEMQNGHKK